MRLLPAAEFRTDISDDGSSDDHEREIPAGYAVATALKELFEAQGFGCDVPEDGGDHGWQFLCRSRGRNLWVSVVAGSDPGYYLTVHNMPWTPLLFWKNKPPPFDQVLKGLDAAMRADGRFHEIRWGREDNVFFRPFEGATPLG